MEEVRMIGNMISEANALHRVIQFDKESLDFDYCRFCVDEIYLWQRDLYHLRGMQRKHSDPDLMSDLRESLIILMRLSNHFGKRKKMIEEIQMNTAYDKDYEMQLRSGA